MIKSIPMYISVIFYECVAEYATSPTFPSNGQLTLKIVCQIVQNQGCNHANDFRVVNILEKPSKH